MMDAKCPVSSVEELSNKRIKARLQMCMMPSLIFKHSNYMLAAYKFGNYDA
jgi:hypothetical protein